MASDKRRPLSAPGRDDILATFRPVLLGSNRNGPRQALLIGLGLGFFALTFLGYELDVFYHSGGVVFIPFHATLVGVTAAFWTGYRRTGLLSGWVLAYLSFLGWRTEWATDISPRPFVERVAYVVRPDGLVVLASIGLGVAIIGFTAGALVRRGIDALRGRPSTATDA